MNRIQHIQYPVGQGGLHLGIVGDVAYIYDCGSVYESRSILYVQQVVNALDNNDIKQLYIFISHLHSDHVCALPDLLHLLQKQNIITKIYLPYITPLEKLYLIASLNDVDSWLIEFIINPQSITKNMEKSDLIITYVSSEEQKKQEYNIDKTPIKSCTKIIDTISKRIGNLNFMFVPFVYPNFGVPKNNIFIRTVQKLVRTTQCFITEQELQQLVTAHIKELREAYSLLSSDINYTSLCLYAGFTDNSIKAEIITYSYRCNYFECQTKSGWLHTGDYNLKCGKGTRYGAKFLNYYKKYFDCVGVVQIPHHGSAGNINSCFINKFNTQDIVFFMTGEICPFGKGQPKRTSMVLQQIKQPVFLVSELPCSRINQHY